MDFGWLCCGNISGEIIEFNDALESAPESVNSDPYGAGWMIKVKVADITELETLLSSDSYKDLIANKTVPSQIEKILIAYVEKKKNILISLM